MSKFIPKSRVQARAALDLTAQLHKLRAKEAEEKAKQLEKSKEALVTNKDNAK
jgi:hypothetical protein